MMNSKLIKYAASGLVIPITMSGCQSSVASYRPAAVSAEAAKADRAGAGAYADAQAAIRKGKVDKALKAMELAVAWSPRDAGYRKGLAELYLQKGRFASAETSFADVVALNPSDSRAGFYLALTRIAQGKTQAALDQLGSMDPTVAPADLGLAYAIAGDPRRALELLEAAVRAPDASGRVRQNLALAYALAGDWKKARLMAAQDVSPSDLNKRMAQWAAIANPAATASRVASLLKVTPAEEDPGQPAQLALAPAPSEATAVAVAAPVPAEPIVAPVETARVAAVERAPAVSSPASVEPAPVEVAVAEAPAAPVFVPAVFDAPKPLVVKASYAEAAQSLVARTSSEAPRIVPTQIPAFPGKRLGRTAPDRYRASRYVVQIGAFKTAAQVEQAWAQAQRRYSFGENRQPVSTTVKINGLGVMHRLAISGFESQDAAARACQSIRTRNGTCFVRTIAGDAPVQWASRYTRKG